MGKPLHTLACWCAALALSLCGLAAASPAAARDFRAADNQTADYPTVLALEYMSRLVAERTQGRHRMIVFHSRQLGEEKETIEQARAGAIDINRINAAPLSSLSPEVETLGLPFLFRSTDQMWSVLQGDIGDQILASLYPHGLVGLTFYESGARSIYNSVRPIRKLEDLKGLRIRVQQSELQKSMIRALGAEPIPLSYGQVMTGLATGIIDGAENNWPSYVTTDHYKVARHYTLTEHTMSPEVLVMSRKAWDALSPEDQKIFKDAARDSGSYMHLQWRAFEDRAREEARSAGNHIVEEFDRAPFEAAMKPIYDEAMKNARMRELVEKIRAAR
ncbi:MAG TPA: TRAP transporter substrate-binding protein [Rhodoblastus sp.]|nr:TRAP transporter substrate-binding protein [Rhodoblastus sp.]